MSQKLICKSHFSELGCIVVTMINWFRWSIINSSGGILKGSVEDEIQEPRALEESTISHFDVLDVAGGKMKMNAGFHFKNSGFSYNVELKLFLVLLLIRKTKK
ncbi:hypothetical protein CDAR_59201 [Caerostris darwini]|uniref:Uncharacterized protein n=1 Tax=Caerostris darwini TaxID=1538125 RepID=A0AAV4X600_9ARAC|nr:hypothetical protein CDAR_59201 [Caerostris darwini]